MANPIPDNLVERVNRMVRTSRQMLVETGHEPSVDELAARTALPPETVRRLLAIARRPIGSPR
ncbi:MAG TPA: sigma-70 domain-containing protein [Stellaceae bacterium]|nr:sigma-70 domain-containing protein [Stellaceae bacterium]